MKTNREIALSSTIERLQGSLAAQILQNLAEGGDGHSIIKTGGPLGKAGSMKVSGTGSFRGSGAGSHGSRRGTNAPTAHWSGFPRTLPAYGDLVSTICDLVTEDLTSNFIDMLLAWLPDKGEKEKSTALGLAYLGHNYGFFLSLITSSIQTLKPNQQEIIDLVVNVVVADILVNFFARRSDRVSSKPPEQLQTLAAWIFKFPLLYRDSKLEPNITLKITACTQLAVVLGFISHLLLTHGTFLYLGSTIAKLKIDTSMSILYLKHLRLAIRTEREVAESKLVIEKFVSFIIERKKSLDVRMYIDVFCDILSSIDMANNPELFNKSKIEGRLLEKMGKSEDLDPVLTRYKAILCAHGSSDFFTSTVQELAQKILKKIQANSKASDEYLDSLVILFRGPYYAIRVGWLPVLDQSKEIDVDNNTILFKARMLPSLQTPEVNFGFPDLPSPFSRAPFFEKMRSPKQTSFEFLRTLIRSIFSTKGKAMYKLWSNTKITFSGVVDLVLGVAAHSFEFLQQELLPNLLGSIPDLVVALQVLNVLVHPSFQYGTKAYCFNSDGVTPTPTQTNETIYVEVIKAVNVAARTLLGSIEIYDSSTENRDNVGCYLSPGKIPFQPYEPFFTSYIETQRATTAFTRSSLARPSLTHLDLALKSSLHRVTRLICPDESERREKSFKTLLTCTKKTTVAIEAWLTGPSPPNASLTAPALAIPFPNAFVGQLQLPDEPKSKVKKPAKDEKLRAQHVILLKEMLNAIMSLPPNEFVQLELAPFWKGEKSAKNVNLLSPLILHQDDELSNLVLHFYQRVIVEIPQYRIILINDLLATCQGIPPSKPSLRLFVLSQVCVLVDLWNAVYYSKIPELDRRAGHYSNQVAAEDAAAVSNLVHSLDRDALFHLASNVPELRLVSLNVMQAACLLHFFHIPFLEETLPMSSILCAHETFILQEARSQYLSDMAQAVFESKRVIRNDVPLELKIKDVAGSTHDRLWVYVLSQIGKAVTVATSDTPAKVRLRTINKLMEEFEGDNYITSQTIVPIGSTEGFQHNVLFTPTTYSYQILLFFSLLSSKILQFGTLIEDDTLPSTFQQKLIKMVTTWTDLSSDHVALTATKALACQMISWDTATVLLSSLWGWYSKMQEKKGDLLTKKRVRPFVTLILYRVSTLSDFAKGMVLSRSTGQCYLQFLEEIPASWEYLYKTSDLEHCFYYLCNAGIVDNVMSALHKQTTDLCLFGPLRKQFQPSVSWVLSDTWNSKHKSNLLSFLKERLPIDFMSNRMRIDRSEVDKQLANAKDPEKKEKVKVVTSKQLKLVAESSAMAIEALSKIFPVFEVPTATTATPQNRMKEIESKLKEVEAWILPMQRICPQAQVLPWCAAGDEDLLTAILDRATEGEREHKNLYSHAVFAQFIASRYYRKERDDRRAAGNATSLATATGEMGRQSVFFAHPMPLSQLEAAGSSGTAPPAEQYKMHKSTSLVMDDFIESRIVEEETEALAATQLTAGDIQFVKRNLQRAGKLIQFFFYCLIQPDLDIRLGAFHSLVRLGPIEFGQRVEVPEPIDIRKVRLLLSHYEYHFHSNIEDMWSDAAAKMSEILSVNCSAMTLDFFMAWFSLFDHLTMSEQQCTSQVLKHWGKNIVLTENGTLFSHQFLETLFAIVTVPCQTLAVFSVWESFSVVSPSNTVFCVKFLLQRAVTKGQMELTRRLIRHLSQSYPEHVMEFLLGHISFHGIMETINKANQEKLSKNPSTQVPIKPQENKVSSSPSKTSKDSLLTTTVRKRRHNSNNPVEKVKGRAAAKTKAKDWMAKETAEDSSDKFRNMATSLIADLIGEKFSPLLSTGLHILIHYCILSLDREPHLVLVFRTVLQGLLQILYEGISRESGEKELKSAFESIAILKNILSIMEVHDNSFIEWTSTTSSNPGERREERENFLKSFPLTQLPTQRQRHQQYMQGSDVHTNFVHMIPQKMHVSQLVDSLCTVLNHPLILGAYNSVKEHVPQLAGLGRTRELVATNSVAQLSKRIQSTTNAINNTEDDNSSLTGSASSNVTPRSGTLNPNRHSNSMTTNPGNIKNITHQWGQHCLLWGVLFADPFMSTKALELYARIIKPCSMETIIKLASNLHICIQRLQTISTVSKAIQQGALSTGFLNSDVHNIDVWKVRIQIIIEAFTQMAVVTDAENYVLYLFWVALSLLESSPLTHSFIYCGAMELLTAVIESRYFPQIAKTSFKPFLSLAPNWKFLGLNALLAGSLRSSKSDLKGATLMRKLFPCHNIPPEVLQMTKTTNPELEEAIWFLSVLPWIFYHSYLNYHMDTDFGPEFSSRNEARLLLATIYEKYGRATSGIQRNIHLFLQRFISENSKDATEPFKSFPFSLATSEQFLMGTVSVLAGYFFPSYGSHCFSTLYDLFHTFPRQYFLPLAKITSELLSAYKLRPDTTIRLQDVLTNLLVFASKDVDLLTTPMMAKLLELPNTAETAKGQSPALPRQGLKNVDVALGNILNYLKTRSNRYSVILNQDQLREAASREFAGDEEKKKMRGKTSRSATDNPAESPKAVSRTLQREPSLGDGDKKNMLAKTRPANPLGSNAPRPGWSTAKILELKKAELGEEEKDSALRISATTLRAMSPRVGSDSKTEKQQPFTSPRPFLGANETHHRESAGKDGKLTASTHSADKLQKADSTPHGHRTKDKDRLASNSKSDLRDHSSNASSSKIESAHTASNSKGELRVLRLVDSRVQLAVTDGLATLRDFNMDSSDTSDSTNDSAEEYVIEGSNSDDDFIDQFELGMVPSHDDFENMRSLLMNVNLDDGDDDDPDSTEESGTSESYDIEDLKFSLEGLEKFDLS